MDMSTSVMADPILIALRAWPAPDKAAESLPYLIARINEQKGSFRNVTEASLEEEIRTQEAGELQIAGDIAKQGADADHADQDDKAKGDELITARGDIIKQVGAAYTASSHALDFISLLLSKHDSKAAEATVSAYVKQTVSLGSLGAEKMQEPERSAEEKSTEDLIGLGWRLQSLTRSADSLLKSASRLEQEVEYEATYWKEILSVKEKGWSICRVPGESHTMGVRFGFAEAHSEFRDRGLAALRRDQSGNVKLDRGPRWQGDKRIRVCILKNDKQVATSGLRTTADEDPSLTASLMRARNSLFDEELMHELHREARSLANQGVRCIGDTIRFPFQHDAELRIDLVPLDKAEEQSQEDATLPTVTAMTLRILLTSAHRDNHNHRSQPPAPLLDSPPTRRIYPILRPIIELDQHHQAIEATRTLFAILKNTLSAAGLSFSTEESSSTLSISTVLGKTSKERGSRVENLMSGLLQPHHARTTFTLPTQRTTLELNIYTSIFPPTFGTSFQLSTISGIPGTAIAEMPESISFQTVDKLSKHLYSILALDLILLIQGDPEISLSWRQLSIYQPELRRTGSGSADRLGLAVNEGGLKLEYLEDGEKRSRTWAHQDVEVEPTESAQGLIDVVRELML